MQYSISKYKNKNTNVLKVIFSPRSCAHLRETARIKSQSGMRTPIRLVSDEALSSLLNPRAAASG